VELEDRMAGATLSSTAWAQRWRGAVLAYDRNIYLLLLFTLGKGFQLSIAALSTQLYVKSLGYPSSFVGLVVGMPAIGALGAAVPVGLLADRLGRKPLLILSGILNPLALAAIGLSTSPALLLGASFLNGVLSSAYWVANIPMLMESCPEEQRVWVLALNNFLLLGVGALGGLIGGAVPELVAGITHASATSVVPLRWGVLASAFVVFLPALPLFGLRETAGGAASPSARPGDTRPVAEGLAPAPATDPSDSVAEARDWPPGWHTLAPLFLKLLIPDALYTMGLGAAIGLLQVFFLLRFRVGPGSLGVLYALAGLAGGVASLAAPRIARRIGQLHTVTTMQYLAIPIVLLMGFAPIFAAAAGADFAYNILAGVFAPVYAAFTMQQVSARARATLSGFYSVTWSVGYSIGPTVAGWLQQHVSLSAAFLMSAVCIGTAATLLRIFFGNQAKRALAADVS
jgi:MFS family permease